MQKNIYLSHSNHSVHNEQLNKLQGAFMPDASEMGISERCKAFHCWPEGCLLLHQLQDKPGDTTAPLQFKPAISEGFEKWRDSIQRVKSGKVTVSRGRANN